MLPGQLSGFFFLNQKKNWLIICQIGNPPTRISGFRHILIFPTWTTTEGMIFIILLRR